MNENYDGAKLDKEQLQAATVIKNFLKDSFRATLQQKIKHIIQTIFGAKNSSTSFKKGIYLYGSVGRGKTFILQTLLQEYCSGKVPGKTMHYNEMVLYLQSKLKTYDNINPIIKEFNRKYKFLMIDEFDILDIVNSVLVRDFILGLFKGGVIIFFTSNKKPGMIYENGLQRQQIIPLIEKIEADCIVINLQGEIDYRINLFRHHPSHYYQCSNSSQAAKVIHDVFTAYVTEQFHNGNFKPSIWQQFAIQNDTHATNQNYVINIGKRTIIPNMAYKNVALFSFDYLCNTPLFYNDYLQIVERYSIIFIENIYELNKENKDLARRFIALIDAVYTFNAIIYCSFSFNWLELQKIGAYIPEFKRTFSRLQELEYKI